MSRYRAWVGVVRRAYQSRARRSRACQSRALMVLLDVSVQLIVSTLPPSLMLWSRQLYFLFPRAITTLIKHKMKLDISNINPNYNMELVGEIVHAMRCVGDKLQCDKAVLTYVLARVYAKNKISPPLYLRTGIHSTYRIRGDPRPHTTVKYFRSGRHYASVHLEQKKGDLNVSIYLPPRTDFYLN